MDAATERLVDPLVGRLLDGRYRLDRVVARGGMATVFAAEDTRLERPVAVKVMHRALAGDPDFVARFAREARAAARLSSPEVVAVYDQGHDEATGAAYLVMELVTGRTLRALVTDSGGLAPAAALAIVEPVLLALAAAHGAGLVHRDIKPENVLLADDGRIKVADFGLARAVETSGLTLTTGLLIGTVAYLAPEQVEHGTADPRSDVYATGILLWEMLTGTVPYGGNTPLSVAYRHVHDDVPPPSTVVPGLPPGLDALVVAATRRDPDQRPADGAQMLAAVRSLRAALPAVPGSHPTLVVPRRPGATASPAAAAAPARRRRRPRPLPLLVALAVLVVAAGGWYLGSNRFTTAPRLLGLPRATAEQALHQAGLQVRYGAPRFDESIPPGDVAGQTPGPGGRVARHGVVTLSLSQGPDRRTVPDVRGMTLQAAGSALAAVGLAVGPTPQEFSSTVPAGQVIRADPAAGQHLRPGTPVTLVMSKGAELLAVPDETGRSQSEAATALKAAGFHPVLSSDFSDTVPNGTVVSQSPRGGQAPRGSDISVVVSKGPQLVTVPDVTGQQVQAAQSELAALGLGSSVRSIPGPGIVRNQSPSPGSQVRRGTVVTLYVF